MDLLGMLHYNSTSPPIITSINPHPSAGELAGLKDLIALLHQAHNLLYVG